MRNEIPSPNGRKPTSTRALAGSVEKDRVQEFGIKGKYLSSEFTFLNSP